MTIESLVVRLHEKEEEARDLRNVALMSEALMNIEEMGLGNLLYSILNNRILIETNDYGKHLRALKMLRKETGQPMPLGMHWYSCGLMLFKWESDHFTLRFECDPEDIPPELMPTDGCTVKKETTTNVSYAIVCPVEGK